MASDINKKTDAELNKDLAEKRKALKDFNFGVSGSKVKNIREGRNTRHEIARILTEQARRRMAK